MSSQYHVNVCSEFGELQCVVLHTPGAEIEAMSPDTVQEALYNDILNINYAQEEHAVFKKVLASVTQVLELKDLLIEVLEQPTERQALLNRLLPTTAPDVLKEQLTQLPSQQLAKALLEGVMLPNKSQTAYAQVEERYILPPLYNFYFMRDASISVFQNALIGRMLNHIRRGEAEIMSVS